jgi:hypothetical protein
MGDTSLVMELINLHFKTNFLVILRDTKVCTTLQIQNFTKADTIHLDLSILVHEKRASTQLRLMSTTLIYVELV